MRSIFGFSCCYLWPSGSSHLLHCCSSFNTKHALTYVTLIHSHMTCPLSTVHCLPDEQQMVPTFKNEIAPDLSQPPAQQKPQLEMDRENLEEKIEKIEERIESLAKLLARSSESRLHNKVNELQEELCQKRFDLHVAQIHLSAVRSQLQLFEYNYRAGLSSQVGVVGSVVSKGLIGSGQDLGVVGGPLVGCESLNSHASNSSSSTLSRKSSSGLGHQPIGYRNKWIKAFKSLKESPSPSQSTLLSNSNQVNQGQK